MKALILVISAFVVFSSTWAEAQEVVKLSIANSLRDSLFKRIEEGFTKSTGIKIEYLENEHLRAQYPSLTIVYFKDVVEKRADAAAAATSYEDWVKLVKSNNVQVPEGITQRVIGKDMISVYASSKVNVPGMTLDQVVSVFTGKIKNWKEIGGADLPILLLHSKDKVSIRSTFQKMALGGKEYGANSEELARLKDAQERIVATPGAVLYDTSIINNPNVKEIKTPAIGRPATMITMGRPNEKVEKLINYIRTNVQ